MSDIQIAGKTIPSIRRLRLGQRTYHRLPGYEQSMTTAYDYALIVEFDDRDGLIAYLQHPAHHEIGRHFTASAERSLAYDYEVSDVGGSPPLP